MNLVLSWNEKFPELKINNRVESLQLFFLVHFDNQKRFSRKFCARQTMKQFREILSKWVNAFKNCNWECWETFRKIVLLGEEPEMSLYPGRTSAELQLSWFSELCNFFSLIMLEWPLNSHFTVKINTTTLFRSVNEHIERINVKCSL